MKLRQLADIKSLFLLSKTTDYTVLLPCSWLMWDTMDSSTLIYTFLDNGVLVIEDATQKKEAQWTYVHSLNVLSITISEDVVHTYDLWVDREREMILLENFTEKDDYILLIANYSKMNIALKGLNSIMFRSLLVPKYIEIRERRLAKQLFFFGSSLFIATIIGLACFTTMFRFISYMILTVIVLSIVCVVIPNYWFSSYVQTLRRQHSMMNPSGINSTLEPAQQVMDNYRQKLILYGFIGGVFAIIVLALLHKFH